MKPFWDVEQLSHHEWSIKGHEPEVEKVFWLSFCDNNRPKGSQFLGACLVKVTGADANDALLMALLRFPHMRENAEWVGAAVRKAHQLGCNPGGEVAFVELPPDQPNLKHYEFGKLMSREEIERIEEVVS